MKGSAGDAVRYRAQTGMEFEGGPSFAKPQEDNTHGGAAFRSTAFTWSTMHFAPCPISSQFSSKSPSYSESLRLQPMEPCALPTRQGESETKVPRQRLLDEGLIKVDRTIYGTIQA